MSRRPLLVLAALVVVAAVWRNRATPGALLLAMAVCGAAGALAVVADHFAAPLRSHGIAGRMAAGAIVIGAMLVPLLVLILLGMDLRPDQA